MPAAIQAGRYAALPNGIRLHYASAGERSRPLLMFVHGFPEFWFEWEAQLKEFGDDWFAVAPDLRGFNLSDMPVEAAAYRAKNIVDDLRLLAGELGYRKFTLVAHDWGGAVAWSFALALPQMLERLIIINSPHPYLFMRALATDPDQRAASEYMNWLRAPGSEDALAQDGFARMDGFFTGMGQSGAPWYDAPTRAKYHECWARGLRGGVNYYRASPLHPPTPEDSSILNMAWNADDFHVSVPTKVIWGERDIALPKTLLNGLEDLVDDLVVERIADGSHWVVHEQPDRVNHLLRGFLS